MNKGTLNRAILIGRVGREPQVHYTSRGNAVAHFSLTTLQRYKDSAGSLKFKPEWHRVVVWNQLAEKCKNLIQKGSLVCVEGMIKTRSTGKSSQLLTEIVVNRLQCLKGRSSKKSEETQKIQSNETAA